MSCFITGHSDRIIEATVKHEVKAMQVVSNVSGFPTFHGVIMKEQRMCAIIMEFFSNHNSTKSYTLADVMRQVGPRIERHQLLKVGGIFFAIITYAHLLLCCLLFPPLYRVSQKR